MLHRARSAPARHDNPSAPAIPLPLTEEGWLKLLESNERRLEPTTRKRQRVGRTETTVRAEVAWRIAASNAKLNEAADAMAANLRSLR